ncbi:hypothetical protein A2U01_0085600, partial [Trifolium medium]|nr:hypothetical protein [Trifolium medium]
GNAAAAIGFMA